MDNVLTQYGGTVGALVIIVMLLVKEVIRTRNPPEHFEDVKDKMMTKELCLERHDHIKSDMEALSDQIDDVKTAVQKLSDKVDDLPRKLNGGAKT